MPHLSRRAIHSAHWDESAGSNINGNIVVVVQRYIFLYIHCIHWERLHFRMMYAFSWYHRCLPYCTSPLNYWSNVRVFREVRTCPTDRYPFRHAKFWRYSLRVPVRQSNTVMHSGGAHSQTTCNRAIDPNHLSCAINVKGKTKIAERDRTHTHIALTRERTRCACVPFACVVYSSFACHTHTHTHVKEGITTAKKIKMLFIGHKSTRIICCDALPWIPLHLHNNEWYSDMHA